MSIQLNVLVLIYLMSAINSIYIFNRDEPISEAKFKLLTSVPVVNSVYTITTVFAKRE